MKLVQWPTPFADVKFLVCEGCIGDGENELKIKLVSHQISKKPYKAKNDDPTEQTLDGAFPVIKRRNFLAWEITFESMIAFKISSESFHSTRYDWSNTVSHTRSHIVQDSPWFKDYSLIGPLADTITTAQHYIILTMHSHLEIIAGSEPVIKKNQSMI